MRAEELEKLVRFKDTLNPDIWQNNNLRREVEYKLLLIAKEFINFINIPDLKLKDITLSGSNASYNYNDHSDLDLHLIVDMDTPCGAQLKELFQAKKSQFNDQYDILIRGHEVEVYAQDAKQPHISNGIYSVINDRWIKQPEKISANPDETNIKHKYEFLKAEIDRAIESGDPRAIARLQLKIKDMRKAGLEKSGEYGVENLAFKLLRNDGTLDALYSAKQKADDMRLSLPEAATAEDLKLINSAIDFIKDNTKIKPVDDAEAKAEEIISKLPDSKLKRKAKEIFFSAKDNPYVQGGLITTLGSLIANGVIATGQKYGLSPTQTNVMLQLIINSVLPAIYNRMAGKNWKDTVKATFASAMVGAGTAAGFGMMEVEKVKENFADGKKPVRKGLAKRMGVPTGASVTRLRQIAKNSTGEKARMAHWMANMKSGKKKD